MISSIARDHFKVSLLAKCSAPTFFKLFRPIATLKARSELRSRCCVQRPRDIRYFPEFSSYGAQENRCMRRLVSVVRLLFEKRAEAGLETHVAQVGFARAYDSILHVAILRAMRRRSVWDTLALA